MLRNRKKDWYSPQMSLALIEPTWAYVLSEQLIMITALMYKVVSSNPLFFRYTRYLILVLLWIVWSALIAIKSLSMSVLYKWYSSAQETAMIFPSRTKKAYCEHWICCWNTETIVFIIFTYLGSQEKRKFSSRKIKQIPKNV